MYGFYIGVVIVTIAYNKTENRFVGLTYLTQPVANLCSMIVNYDSTVVPDLKIHHITTLQS